MLRCSWGFGCLSAAGLGNQTPPSTFKFGFGVDAKCELQPSKTPSKSKPREHYFCSGHAVVSLKGSFIRELGGGRGCLFFWQFFFQKNDAKIPHFLISHGIQHYQQSHFIDLSGVSLTINFGGGWGGGFF